MSVGGTDIKHHIEDFSFTQMAVQNRQKSIVGFLPIYIIKDVDNYLFVQSPLQNSGVNVVGINVCDLW